MSGRPEEAYLPKAQGEGHSLQLSPREVSDLLVKDVVQLQWPYHVRHELRVHVRVSDLVVQQLAYCARELRADLLRLVAHIHLRHIR